MASLQHYGVKGQKWGVRRYQNLDGSLTKAGKTRYAASKVYRNVVNTRDDVQGIVDSLTPKERKLLGGKPGTSYMPDDEIGSVAKRFIKKAGKTPVAFLDIYYAGNDAGSIALATKSGKEYRGKGYASKLVKEAQDWLETPEAKEALQISTLNWFARRENEPSIALSKKYGFKERKDYKEDKEWYGARYRRSNSEASLDGLSSKGYNEIKKIHASLSDKEKWYLGDMSVSKYTTYAKVKNGAYITLDDYKGQFKDEHPYSGKIISIAASPKSRGTGATDQLIQNAIKDNRSSRLIAEIDDGNVKSQRLFERNGFKLIDQKDGIKYYAYKAKRAK